MTSTTHPVESTPATLYVALELSTKEWWLTMSPSPHVRARRVRVRVGDHEGLAGALHAARSHFGLPSDGPIVSCYEAGRDGFWPHRLLATLGVTNLVVDSSSIEVSRRARQVKTDRPGASGRRPRRRPWPSVWSACEGLRRVAPSCSPTNCGRATFAIGGNWAA